MVDEPEKPEEDFSIEVLRQLDNSDYTDAVFPVIGKASSIEGRHVT